MVEGNTGEKERNRNREGERGSYIAIARKKFILTKVIESLQGLFTGDAICFVRFNSVIIAQLFNIDTKSFFYRTHSLRFSSTCVRARIYATVPIVKHINNPRVIDGEREEESVCVCERENKEVSDDDDAR